MIDYLLHLADSTLILSQRNSEWCGHGPILEQDIAITNISLDLLGQSRNFYQYAAQLINAKDNTNATEDTLAYLRTEREFKNLLLTELPKGDWAVTVLRQYLFSQYQFLLFEQLQHHNDRQLAAICAKALKEIKYHVRWSSEWVIRMGDGTEESNQRIKQAIEDIWPYAFEMFMPASYEVDVNLSNIQSQWLQQVAKVFDEATLQVPKNVFMHSGGKNGTHTEHLGFILTDLQYLQRTYPGANW